MGPVGDVEVHSGAEEASSAAKGIVGTWRSAPEAARSGKGQDGPRRPAGAEELCQLGSAGLASSEVRMRTFPDERLELARVEPAGVEDAQADPLRPGVAGGVEEGLAARTGRRG